MPNTAPRIYSFVQEAKGKSYFDILDMAIDEATEAERTVYKLRSKTGPKTIPEGRYAADLKGFIAFMRYGVKPRGLDEDQYNLYHSVRQLALNPDSSRS